MRYLAILPLWGLFPPIYVKINFCLFSQFCLLERFEPINNPTLETIIKFYNGTVLTYLRPSIPFPAFREEFKIQYEFQKTQFEHDWQRIINLRRIIKTPEFEVSVYATPNWSLEPRLRETEKWQVTLKYGCLGHAKKTYRWLG